MLDNRCFSAKIFSFVYNLEIMPRHASSPYWAAVDFDSEDDGPSPPPKNRIYSDLWDNEDGDNFNSFAGEPVSASFYYVPTKNYDSGEEPPLPPPRRNKLSEDDTRDSIYGRKFSRSLMPEYQERPIYGEKTMRGRRRSMYTEEPIYVSHPMQMEPIYGAVMPPPGYISPMPSPRPRSRISLTHQPDYVMANYAHGIQRRQSRLMDAYESLSPEYEDWARPFPKAAPENFHLSRYGHLQIDYSFSWNSLDRLIRYQ